MVSFLLESFSPLLSTDSIRGFKLFFFFDCDIVLSFEKVVLKLNVLRWFAPMDFYFITYAFLYSFLKTIVTKGSKIK